MKLKRFQKLLTIIAIVSLVFIIAVLVGASMIFKKDRKKERWGKYDIALLKYDTIDELYFEQIRQGVERASASFDKRYKVMSVSEYKDSYEDTLKAAVEEDIGIVVFPDAAFEEVVYNYQKIYPYTQMVLVDGIPHNADGSDIVMNNNVVCVQYDESEAGFLAGYAAVYSGYHKLAFVCEDTSVKSVHYCYGFLQGADCAAKDLGSKEVIVDMVHHTAEETVDMLAMRIPKDAQITAALDTEVIEKLKAADRKVIYCGGYDIEAENVVATVNNDIAAIVNDVVVDCIAGKAEGGAIVTFDISNNSIAFKTEENEFEAFTEEVRKSLEKRIKDGEIALISDATVTTEELGLTNLTVRNR